VIQAGQTRFPAVSIQQACHLLGACRATYYRQGAVKAPDPEETALRAAIEQMALEFPGYGYRRVTKQLQRDGFGVNHKRVLRLMREECLLCQLKRHWVKTTDSEHGYRTYPNLLPDRGWRQLTTINQAWTADITYVRLPKEFAYLAVLLDAYSRRVVGWCLSRQIDAQVAITALERALAWRQPPSGWIHHSDRGVQYASREYVRRLEGAGARISMAARGTPLENAQAESFMRTLKREEVYLNDYQGFEEAEGSIGRFIEEVYDQKRLHSALGYRPPSEFEELLAAGIRP
jgi:putative transposase